MGSQRESGNQSAVQREHDHASSQHLNGSGGPTCGPFVLIAMSSWAGLLAGLIELAPILAKTYLSQHGLLRRSPHVLWMAPVANLLLLGLVGVLVALFVRPIPRIGHRLSAGVVGTLAIFSLLLAVPGMKALAALTLAVGLSSWLVPALLHRPAAFGRLVRGSTPWLLATLLVLFAITACREWFPGSASAQATLAPQGSPNVILLVMDTVRADATSLYGASRQTTPNLAKLATQGVLFDRAISTAPWTLPSHASMFTGRSSWELGVGPNQPLTDRFPTLADYLRNKGYATGGFVANTFLCSKEFGLGRGFEHYQDYIITPLELIRSSALGWFGLGLAKNVIDRVGERAGWEPGHALEFTYERKSAEQINKAALGWVSRQGNRPFFLFLNYFDVHDPYLLPTGIASKFSTDRPNTLASRKLLRDWITEDRPARSALDILLARDAYDDCLAYLDDQIGRFMQGLERAGLLENSIVVITSDHGEHFGEHERNGKLMVGHQSSVYQAEVHVPLLVLAPGRIGPARQKSAVSLRDLPITLLNLAGLVEGSPFTGRSWFDTPAQNEGRGGDAQTPRVALSEYIPRTDLVSSTIGGPEAQVPMRAVVDDEHAYHRFGDGREQLYDLKADPGESHNLAADGPAPPPLEGLRQTLPKLVPPKILEQNP